VRGVERNVCLQMQQWSLGDQRRLKLREPPLAELY
jgi:hypothetical protein